MHMADALVSPAVAGTMYACSTAVAAVSIRKVHIENDPKKIPMMGVMGAFVFAAQMINFTIPGTGASGHLCGGMLLSAVLGPWAGFLTMIGVLLIQCLFFADGGLLALGCNIWNMAFYGCFIGALCIWKPMMNRIMTRKRIVIASVVGCVLTLQMGALSVTVETLASGITDLPFAVFVSVMQPIHLVIGLVEGLITAAVLLFVYDARPELLLGSAKRQKDEGRFSLKRTLLILAVAALCLGFVVSRAASANPDGLEWSIARITGTTELEAEGEIYDTASELQEKTAVMPDYSLKDPDVKTGPVFTGAVGSVIVLSACAVFSVSFRSVRKRRRQDE